MKRTFIALGFTLLTGCATVAPPPPADMPVLSRTARTQALSALHDWQLSGALGIQTQNNQGGSAHWQWQQNGRHYTMTLMGPLGMGTVRVSGMPGNVVLQTADGKKIVAKNADELLLQQTGWPIPVENLYYWIRSLPVPSIHATQKFDARNRLVFLQQQGWTVRYQEYTVRDHLEVPARMLIQGPGITVKIVINLS